MIRSDLQELIHTPPLLLRHATGTGAVLGILGVMELNLSGYPFPGWSTAESRRAVADKLLPVLRSMPRRKWALCAQLTELSLEERYVLLERGQLTPSLAARQDGAYLLLSDSQDTECFINDEEHLHLQTFFPGEGIHPLPQAEKALRQLREQLCSGLDTAYDSTLGYLSCDPSKAGAGLFFSFPAFLPGLRITKHMDQVRHALEELGMYISPFFAYQKGDEGDMWMLHSPPAALNRLEPTLQDLSTVISDLEAQELKARDKLLSGATTRARLQKNVQAACRELTQAASLRYGRILEALSLLRLGLHYGWVQAGAPAAAELLAAAYLETATMHLKYCAGAASERARGKARAAYLHELATHKLQLTYHL